MAGGKDLALKRTALLLRTRRRRRCLRSRRRACRAACLSLISVRYSPLALKTSIRPSGPRRCDHGAGDVDVAVAVDGACRRVRRRLWAGDRRRRRRGGIGQRPGSGDFVEGRGRAVAAQGEQRVEGVFFGGEGGGGEEEGEEGRGGEGEQGSGGRVAGGLVGVPFSSADFSLVFASRPRGRLVYSNCAFTSMSSPSVTVHVPVPEQPLPLQPSKAEPLPTAVASRVTSSACVEGGFLASAEVAAEDAGGLALDDALARSFLAQGQQVLGVLLEACGCLVVFAHRQLAGAGAFAVAFPAGEVEVACRGRGEGDGGSLGDGGEGPLAGIQAGDRPAGALRLAGARAFCL